MKFVIFLCIASVAALAQKLPVPDIGSGDDCPKGWRHGGGTLFQIGSLYEGPNYRMEKPCFPEDGLSEDYYLYTHGKTQGRDGNPGWETSFRQYGKTWSHQINGFDLWDGRQMKVDDVFENRGKVLQEEFKDRGAHLLASNETQDQWRRQGTFTYRDGSAKVFVKLIVACTLIVEQRVKVACTKV
jgi:hypothetical protein